MLEKVRKFLFQISGAVNRAGGATAAEESPTGLATVARALTRPVPEHVGWRHLLGGLVVFLFLVQVVTGTLLGAYYHPALTSARDSVEFIALHVSYGWLVRSVHLWAGELLVAVIALHMLRVLIDRAHHSPRAGNWAMGALLYVLILGFRFTGHVLPCDQTAYWSAAQEARIIGDLPLIGGVLQSVLYGGSAISEQTISRFHSLHTLILPWITFFAVSVHLYLVWRHGIARPASPERTEN